MERIDDLQVNGLKIIQDDEYFCFGTDSVEISNFVDTRLGDRAIDLGAGNGIITILLSGKKGIFTTAVEIDSHSYSLIERNIKLNNLKSRANALNMPIQQLKTVIKSGEYNIVVSNPPYFEVNSGFNSVKNKMSARKEIYLTQTELLEMASYLLNDKGRFYVVYPVNRLAQMLSNCIKHKLQPKEMILLNSKDKPPHLFLLKCVKNAKTGIKIQTRQIKNFGME